eukprot:Nk52_evm26s293 gene=Nk52_evmTU26s293
MRGILAGLGGFGSCRKRLLEGSRLPTIHSRSSSSSSSSSSSFSPFSCVIPELTKLRTKPPKRGSKLLDDYVKTPFSMWRKYRGIRGANGGVDGLGKRGFSTSTWSGCDAYKTTLSSHLDTGSAAGTNVKVENTRYDLGREDKGARRASADGSKGDVEGYVTLKEIGKTIIVKDGEIEQKEILEDRIVKRFSSIRENEKYRKSDGRLKLSIPKMMGLCKLVTNCGHRKLDASHVERLKLLLMLEANIHQDRLLCNDLVKAYLYTFLDFGVLGNIKLWERENYEGMIEEAETVFDVTDWRGACHGLWLSRSLVGLVVHGSVESLDDLFQHLKREKVAVRGALAEVLSRFVRRSPGLMSHLLDCLNGGTDKSMDFILIEGCLEAGLIEQAKDIADKMRKTDSDNAHTYYPFFKYYSRLKKPITTMQEKDWLTSALHRILKKDFVLSPSCYRHIILVMCRMNFFEGAREMWEMYSRIMCKNGGKVDDFVVVGVVEEIARASPKEGVNSIIEKASCFFHMAGEPVLVPPLLLEYSKAFVYLAKGDVRSASEVVLSGIEDRSTAISKYTRERAISGCVKMANRTRRAHVLRQLHRYVDEIEKRNPMAISKDIQSKILQKRALNGESPKGMLQNKNEGSLEYILNYFPAYMQGKIFKGEIYWAIQMLSQMRSRENVDLNIYSHLLSLAWESVLKTDDPQSVCKFFYEQEKLQFYPSDKNDGEFMALLLKHKWLKNLYSHIYWIKKKDTKAKKSVFGSYFYNTAKHLNSETSNVKRNHLGHHLLETVKKSEIDDFDILCGLAKIFVMDNGPSKPGIVFFNEILEPLVKNLCVKIALLDPKTSSFCREMPTEDVMHLRKLYPLAVGLCTRNSLIYDGLSIYFAVKELENSKNHLIIQDEKSYSSTVELFQRLGNFSQICMLTDEASRKGIFLKEITNQAA